MIDYFKQVLEKKPKPLYKSEYVFAEKIEDTKIPRPKSEKMKVAHPELYDFLMTRKPEGRFHVSLIHIDGDGSRSRYLTTLGGKTTSEAYKILQQEFSESLLEIAKTMKANPTTDLGKIDFFTSASVLWTDFFTPQELKAEFFEIDDGEELKFNSASHRHIKRTYKNLAKKDPEAFKRFQNRPIKPAQIILISREALLTFLEKSISFSDSN